MIHMIKTSFDGMKIDHVRWAGKKMLHHVMWHLIVLYVKHHSIVYVMCWPTCNGDSSGRGAGCFPWQHLKKLSMQASFLHTS